MRRRRPITGAGSLRRMTVVQTFESVEAMIEAADNSVKNGHIHRGSDATFARSEFIGRNFEGWNDVRDRANQTWEEGVRILDDMMAELSKTDLPSPTSRRRKARWSDCEGDEM